MEYLQDIPVELVEEAPANALVPTMPHCAVVLVLDTSHSMYRGTALADLHRSVRAFLGAIGEHAFRGASVDVAAVGMGDDLRVLDDFQPFARSRLGTMRIRPKGDSPLGGALRLALACIDRQEAGYRAADVASVTPQLVVLSDGVSTDSYAAELAEVRRRVTAGELCVHAIALGPSADRAVLSALAGSNVFDPFGADMSGAFAAAGRDLTRRYEHAAAEAFSVSAPATAAGGDYFRDHVFYIDGSNLLWWDSRNGLRLDIVLSLARELKARGADYRVFFDASAPHKLREKGRPGDERRYEEILRQRPDRFVQVPAGTEADAFILMKADRDARAVVVSQDRFRDREAIYPWVRDPARCLTGMALDGMLLFPKIGLCVPYGER